MRKIKCLIAVLTALLLAALLVIPVWTPAETSEKLHVTASVFPAYDFARAVCGDLADVSLLLPPGAESHSYEPSPQDILSVQGSALFVCLGGETENWVEVILDTLDNPVETLRMTDCVELLEEELLEGMTSREHREEGETAELDEHVWTDPSNAAAITRAIGETMALTDPIHAEQYRANAESYAAEIETLDEQFQAFFDRTGCRTLVFGDRFPLRYFANAYHLDCRAAFPGCSTQTEPSAATIAYLIDRIRTENLPVVFYIEFSNHLVADCIAEAAGVETALFHSCHNVSQEELDAGVTYVTLMRQNLSTLERVL